jgi:hypothetical protein
MPNQEVMREWTNRLRSGDYEQGRGVLRANGRFCCLGVLCEIAAEHGVINPAVPLPPNDGKLFAPQDVYAYDNVAVTMPPRAVLEWAGIPGYIQGDSLQDGELSARALAYRNDEGRQTFADIANAIEAEWIDPPTVPDTPAAIADDVLVNA